MTPKILLMYSTHAASRKHLEKLSQIASRHDVCLVASEVEAKKYAKETEVILGHRYLRQIIHDTRYLKWIQTTAAGVDRLPLEIIRQHHVLLTRCTISSPAIAQHAYTLAWTLLRRLPQCIARQGTKSQPVIIEPLPWPKTALILGFGSIGRELAKLLKNNDIKVIGVKREFDNFSQQLCDKLLTGPFWREALPKTDLCFLTLPLNDSTKDLFDARALKSLPPHAVVVNVGRGETLDTNTLIELLKNNQLGGAGIDVLADKESYGEDHPIWSIPNLIITPHMAAHYAERGHDLENFIEAQVQRYYTGKPLENCVNLN